MGLLEQNIVLKQTRAGISKAALAGLSGLSETRLSSGLLCTKPLGGEILLKIDSILKDLLDVQEIISPLRIPLADVAQLRVLLEKYREGGLATLRDHETLMELRREVALLTRT